MEYKVIRSNAELYHHGIKGQKWGKRNGPPYPLDESDKSPRERRLTDKQKRIIKRAAIAIGAAAVVGSSIYLVKTGKLDKLGIVSGQKFCESLKGDILGIDEPTGKQASSIQEFEQAVTNINPSHSKVNCGSCSSAALYNMSHVGGEKAIALSEVPEHMRKAGGKGYDPDKLIECYQSGSWNKISAKNRMEVQSKIEKEVLSYGEGAKGIFFTDNLIGKESGHYFSWVVKDNKLYVVEGQPVGAQSNGIVWSGDKLYENVFRHFNNPLDSDIRVARLDTNGIVNIKPGREKDLFEIRK